MPVPPCVADNAVEHLVGKVQTVPVLLKQLHHAHALLIMREASRHNVVKRPFTRMTERSVTEVMAERNRLSERLIEPQTHGNCPRNLRHLKGVGEPCSVMVTLGREKSLGFVLEPAEGVGVNYPVPVALKARAYITFLLGTFSAPARVREAGVRGEAAVLNGTGHLADSQIVHNITASQ